ncbi:hypothetical protein RB195_001192 [Necator americanus]|uniref:Uncharacterized protein n=1 Tax=Necator americanus TaxID=51031 RepID=A0ABR1DD43_NECAM
MFSSIVSDVDEVLEPYPVELSTGPSVQQTRHPISLVEPGLPRDFASLGVHCSVLLVHLSSILLIMRPAHLCFAFDIYSAGSRRRDIPLKSELRRPAKCSEEKLSFRRHLSKALWVVSSFLDMAAVSAHVSAA